MAMPEGIHTLQGRIDSFAIAHLAKRRASSVKKRTPATVSWPHASPLPVELARAGFFYKPTSDSNDNCMCFVCQRQLDGWEEGDDPVSEHLKHAPDCGWAINASISQKINNAQPVDEDPMSEKLTQARTDTFGELWPYEQKKGWKCKVGKMIAAGWCYDPSPEYDDGVTCMYCNLSLDGWEPKDDPFAEHQRRSPDCEFFRLLDEWESARKQAKARKGRASRGSKASRLSTQSMASAVSEAPSQLSLGDLDEPVGEDDSILTAATNATTTSATGRGRKKGKGATKGKGKTARGKKAAAVDDSIMEVDPPEPVAEEPIVEEPVPEEPPKRQPRRKASRAEPSNIEEVLNASQSQRPTRGRPTKAKPRMSEDASQLHLELQAAIDVTLVSSEGTPKPKRGTKRTSDGVPKLDSSALILSEAPAESQSQQEKPKRGRKPKKQPAKKTEPELEPQPEPEVELEPGYGPRSSDFVISPPRVSEIPKAAPKSKKGKKVAKAAPVEPEPEPEPELETIEPELEDQENEEPFDFARSLVNPINPYADVHVTPELTPNEPSPAPSTPTPVRARPSSTSTRQHIRATPAKPVAQPKDTTPTPSPQSSDAENRPPSSRPASVRPPLSVLPQLQPQLQSVSRQGIRVPLADATPSHTGNNNAINIPASASPSKRNVLGGISSTIPWSATDLELVFLNSPFKPSLTHPSQKDKENALDNINLDIEKLSKEQLREVVRMVKQGLTSPEKKMSVEEWVRWNARQGEEKLRAECEELVMRFEGEGQRAVRSLEGVVES